MKKYSIIYCDPPWDLKGKMHTSASRGEKRNLYKTMTIKELCAMPVKDMTSENAALFMWITMPYLDKCWPIIEAWGFKYKTCAFNWVKTTSKQNKIWWGLGAWTRSNAELCLLAFKGKMERKARNINQIIMAPPREHSRKPDDTRDKIVDLLGDLPRIELFARTRTPGWDVWGNETDKFQ